MRNLFGRDLVPDGCADLTHCSAASNPKMWPGLAQMSLRHYVPAARASDPRGNGPPMKAIYAEMGSKIGAGIPANASLARLLAKLLLRRP